MYQEERFTRLPPCNVLHHRIVAAFFAFVNRRDEFTDTFLNIQPHDFQKHVYGSFHVHE